MKGETKSSDLVDKLMNKGNLSESLKVAASIDAALKKNFYPDSKRVAELSAKEQESRRKFKEKINKLKKMPMPPQIINVNNEGLTEGELTIGNVKRKCKQMMNKILKECLPSAATDYEKNQIKRCFGTKPIDSAVYKFACILPPFKRSISGGGKDIESMLSKSLALLPHQIHNQRFVLMSTDKDKSGNISSQGITLPPSKSGDEKPGIIPTPDPDTSKKALEAKDPLKPLESQDAHESQSNVEVNKNYELKSKEKLLKDIAAMNNAAVRDLEVMNGASTKNIEDIVLPKIKEPEKTAEPAISFQPEKTVEPAKSFQPEKTVEPAKSFEPEIIAEPAKSLDPVVKPAEVPPPPPKKIIPTIDLAPDHGPKAKSPTIHPTEPNKPLELVTKGPFAETANEPPAEVAKNKETIVPDPIRRANKAPVGFIASVLQSIKEKTRYNQNEPTTIFLVVGSFFEHINYLKIINSTIISGRKEPPHKMKILPPLFTINKIPFKWTQGVIMVGIFIPLYYSYHKLIIEKELTLKLSEEN